MKYSKWVGIAGTILTVVSTWLPWIYIEAIQTTVTGLHATGTSFGKPGLMNIYLSAAAFLLFLLPVIWAKRTNIFICALNLAWTLRNLIIIPACHAGECPEKKTGIYLLFISSLLMMAGALFPQGKIPQPKNVD